MTPEDHDRRAFASPKRTPAVQRREKRDNRTAAIVAHEAARFIANEAGPGSLITVTRAQVSSRGDRVSVFVSIFPETQAARALDFLTRQREAFSDYLKEHARLSPLPRVSFMLEPESAA